MVQGYKMSGQETDSAPIDAICHTKDNECSLLDIIAYNIANRVGFVQKVINAVTVYDLHPSNPYNRIQLD
jgi:hypothetical protein